MEHEDLTGRILHHAFEVHSALGPGLLERAYQECLAYELEEAGLTLAREVSMAIAYKKLNIPAAYRIDLLVENQVIVELKCVDELHDIHLAQALTYMRLSGIRTGLLLNFKTKHLRNGIKRLAL